MEDIGFVIPVPDKYVAHCLDNVMRLRNIFHVDLPIEIWQVGEELSKAATDVLLSLGPTKLRNVNEITDNLEHWRGFQVKAMALKHSNFQQPILCDADISFHQNPLIVLQDPAYLETGTFFFRDLDRWRFYNLHENLVNKFESLQFYQYRRGFVKALIAKPSQYFPPEWLHLYDEHVPSIPVPEAYQESGVVYIDRRRHSDTIDTIFTLNDNHPYTYQFIWGDKETYWLSCLINGKPFSINESHGYIGLSGKLSHDYRGALFFTQK